MKINSLSIENNQIVVEKTMRGPNDRMCYPAQRIVQNAVFRETFFSRAIAKIEVQPDKRLSASFERVLGSASRLLPISDLKR